jgi:hypothetical protein
MMSFEATVKSDGHLRNAHILNARQLIVPKCRIFRPGVSQYLLINIKVHKESDDDRLTSSWPLLMARDGAGQRLFGTPLLSGRRPYIAFSSTSNP